MTRKFFMGFFLALVMTTPAWAQVLPGGECTATINPPNTEADLAGYRFHIRTPSGTFKDPPNYTSSRADAKAPMPAPTATCKQMGVTDKGSYFVAGRAFDFSGNVSGYSPETGFTLTNDGPKSAIVTSLKPDADGATITISGPAQELQVGSGESTGYETMTDYVKGSATYRYNRRWKSTTDWACARVKGTDNVWTEQGCNKVIPGPPITPPPPPPVKMQCEDGVDNDKDGKIDHPADPGCTDPKDNDETDPTPPPKPACSDGIDNDNDGKTDHPADPGCTGPEDPDETDPVLPPDADLKALKEAVAEMQGSLQTMKEDLVERRTRIEAIEALLRQLGAILKAQ